MRAVVDATRPREAGRTLRYVIARSDGEDVPVVVSWSSVAEQEISAGADNRLRAFIDEAGLPWAVVLAEVVDRSRGEYGEVVLRDSLIGVERRIVRTL